MKQKIFLTNDTDMVSFSYEIDYPEYGLRGQGPFLYGKAERKSGFGFPSGERT